jgi:hypothetical protein
MMFPMRTANAGERTESRSNLKWKGWRAPAASSMSLVDYVNYALRASSYERRIGFLNRDRELDRSHWHQSDRSGSHGHGRR